MRRRRSSCNLRSTIPARTGKVSIGCIAEVSPRQAGVGHRVLEPESSKSSRPHQIPRRRGRPGTAGWCELAARHRSTAGRSSVRAWTYRPIARTRLPSGVNIDSQATRPCPTRWCTSATWPIISHAPGEGILSGSIVTADRDALTAVSGVPLKADGTEGAPFTVTVPEHGVGARTAHLGCAHQIRRRSSVKSPISRPGLDAIVTLAFQNCRRGDSAVPVLDGNLGPVRAHSSRRQRLQRVHGGRAQPSNL